jgi:hypothetical protein
VTKVKFPNEFSILIKIRDLFTFLYFIPIILIVGIYKFYWAGKKKCGIVPEDESVFERSLSGLESPFVSQLLLITVKFGIRAGMGFEELFLLGIGLDNISLANSDDAATVKLE